MTKKNKEILKPQNQFLVNGVERSPRTKLLILFEIRK